MFLGGAETYYENQGILEDTFVHEASHTSLDSYHAESSSWLDAQLADCEFISDYARDYPIREDIAESYLPYLAIRYRSDRISEDLKKKIEDAIPNRIKGRSCIYAMSTPLSVFCEGCTKTTFPSFSIAPKIKTSDTTPAIFFLGKLQTPITCFPIRFSFE